MSSDRWWIISRLSINWRLSNEVTINLLKVDCHSDYQNSELILNAFGFKQTLGFDTLYQLFINFALSAGHYDQKCYKFGWSIWNRLLIRCSKLNFLIQQVLTIRGSLRPSNRELIALKTIALRRFTRTNHRTRRVKKPNKLTNCY